MTSYNRIGAVPSCANQGVMKDIIQGEWGFHGFSVTDFSSVCLKTSPKEALLAGIVIYVISLVAAVVSDWGK